MRAHTHTLYLSLESQNKAKSETAQLKRSPQALKQRHDDWYGGPQSQTTLFVLCSCLIVTAEFNFLAFLSVKAT